MNSGASKSSDQSYIYVISVISKLGVDRIHLWSRGVLLEVKGIHGPTVPDVNIMPFMPICIDTVGSPSQRAIYNLCSSLIQITFNVRSESSISSFSPILTLFQGSYKWIVIGNVNSIRVCDDNNSQLRSYEIFTYRLAHISSQCQKLSLGLIREKFLIYKFESGMDVSDV